MKDYLLIQDMKKNNLYIAPIVLLSIASYFILAKKKPSQEVIPIKKEVTNKSSLEARKSIKSIRYIKNMNLASKIFPEICSESFVNLKRDDTC